MSMHGPCARMTLHGFALVDVSHGSWTVHAKRIEYCRPCGSSKKVRAAPFGFAICQRRLQQATHDQRRGCTQNAFISCRHWGCFALSRDALADISEHESFPTHEESDPTSSDEGERTHSFFEALRGRTAVYSGSRHGWLIQLPMRWSEVKAQRVLLRTQMMMLKHPQMSGDDTTAARRAKYQIQTCGHTCIALSSDVRKPATEKEAKDAVQSHSIALTLRHQLSAFALGQAYGQLGSWVVLFYLQKGRPEDNTDLK